MNQADRVMSEEAQVAKVCRDYCKSAGLKARVRSQYGSVYVTLYDQSPEIIQQFKERFNSYLENPFINTGSSEVEDSPETPLARYLFVDNELSGALKQDAWDYAREHFSEAQGKPENYKDISLSVRIWGQPVVEFMNHFLRLNINASSIKFWSEREAL